MQVEDYGNREKATKVVKDAIELYDKTFRNKIEVHVPGQEAAVYLQPSEQLSSPKKVVEEQPTVPVEPLDLAAQPK